MTLSQTALTSLPLVGRGKVRDTYALGDERLLLVTTDRLSAFDVVFAEPIPDKGRVLTQLSAWWFRRLAGLGPHHFLGLELEGSLDAAALGSRLLAEGLVVNVPAPATIRLLPPLTDGTRKMRAL